MSEVAENEGLPAGRRPVTCRCLKGSSQSTFSSFQLPATGGVRAHHRDSWKREYLWLGQASSRVAATQRPRRQSPARWGSGCSRARHALRRASSGGDARWRGEEATAQEMQEGACAPGF